MCDYCEDNPVIMKEKRTSAGIYGHAVLQMYISNDGHGGYINILSRNGERFPELVIQKQIFFCPMCGQRLRRE